MAASEAVYQFETFTLDLTRGALLDANGAEVPLRAKSFELLRLFVTNAGKLLDRDTINQAIWWNVVVTDDAITQCVRDIRQAIGDIGRQRIIKTVPRRGYIFSAEVACSELDRQRAAAPDATAFPNKPAIAVLRFANLSGDPEQEYFSDGLGDDIITALSRSRSLVVIARNSSFAYQCKTLDVKQVARELGVRYIVEGSVRRNAGRLRVNAQLIDAETGMHIWAERYDRQVGKIYSVQDDITVAVVTAVLPAITDAELGRILRKPPEANGTDNEQAKEFLQRAISLDPTLAAAYSHLALVCLTEGTLYAARPLTDALRAATTMALKAVMHDPDDADAHAVLAFIAHADRKPEEALERACLALDSNVNSPLAHGIKGILLAWNGQTVEGRQEMLVALRLNPHDARNARIDSNIAISYHYEGDYRNAAVAAKRVVRRFPHYPPSYCWLAAALGQLGNTDEARDALKQAIAIFPLAFDSYVRDRPPWFRPEQHDHLLDGLHKAGWQG